MRNRVATELDLRTALMSVIMRAGRLMSAYFFMIMYRNAFPRVWSSLSNANEAAVSELPGSYAVISISRPARLLYSGAYHSQSLLFVNEVGVAGFGACRSVFHGLIDTFLRHYPVLYGLPPGQTGCPGGLAPDKC